MSLRTRVEELEGWISKLQGDFRTHRATCHETAHHACAVCGVIGHETEMQKRYSSELEPVGASRLLLPICRWVHLVCIPGSGFDSRKNERRAEARSADLRKKGKKAKEQGDG